MKLNLVASLLYPGPRCLPLYTLNPVVSLLYHEPGCLPFIPLIWLPPFYTPLSRFIPSFYRNAVCEHVRHRPSFLKTRGVRTHLSLRTKIICCVRIISSSHVLRSVPGDRFSKVIVNRKSKITLTISLRARIREFH
jgi:hypothetical protein